MLTENFTLSAGGTVKFIDQGKFLRILAAEAPLTVRVYKNGQVITESPQVLSGFAELYEQNFDEVEVYSATAQTIQIALRLGSNVYYDQAPSGVVTINGTVTVDDTTPVNATGANTAKTVTNASTSLVAANANRKYLAIQNKDASGKIYINFGAAATVANGILIKPDSFFELNANMLTAQIFAIGDIASNANIVVVEG